MIGIHSNYLLLILKKYTSTCIFLNIYFKYLSILKNIFIILLYYVNLSPSFL